MTELEKEECGERAIEGNSKTYRQRQWHSWRMKEDCGDRARAIHIRKRPQRQTKTETVAELENEGRMWG